MSSSSVLRRRVFYSECLEAVENHHRKHKKNQIQKNHHTGYVWSAGDTLARYRIGTGTARSMSESMLDEVDSLT